MTDTVGGFTYRRLVDAGIAGGTRVLDIGCGTGGVALLVGNLVGAQGAVVGVDPDADSLATARDRACERHRPNVTFAQGDFEALPPGIGVFGAVVGRRVRMYLPDAVHAV